MWFVPGPLGHQVPQDQHHCISREHNVAQTVSGEMVLLSCIQVFLLLEHTEKLSNERIMKWSGLVMGITLAFQVSCSGC